MLLLLILHLPPAAAVSQAPAVRRACLLALAALYSDESTVSSLATFTHRFAPRIVQMAVADRDPTVAAVALHLTALLYRWGCTGAAVLLNTCSNTEGAIFPLSTLDLLLSVLSPLTIAAGTVASPRSSWKQPLA